MLIFLTGASGSLGRNALLYLLEQDASVQIRALSRSDNAGKAILTAAGNHSKRVQIVSGDLDDEDALRTGMEGCQAVVHMAAKVGDVGILPDFLHANVVGTRNMLTAARKAGVHKFVHVSSFVVLAKHHDLAAGPKPYPYTADNPIPPPTTERPPAHTDLIPDWAPYSKSKALAEELVLNAHTTDSNAKLIACSLRIGWLWSANEAVLLPRLIDVVNNPGWSILPRTWPNATCHMQNACEAIWCALQHGRQGVAYEIADPQGPMYMESWAPRLVALATGMPEVKPPSEAWRMKIGWMWPMIGLMDYMPQSLKWPKSWYTAMTRQALALLYWDFRLDTTRAKEEIRYVGRVGWEEGCEEVKIHRLGIEQ
ncbi:hypothetical protein BC936DRAFT_149026 [Jimgerdemannia flammicorona]|uniref:NAD-dependent epimerase/dehydratase domain-containing protein n=1 Tax=Jimgerdemannia flammicorona TaxID=994334 RepID=A0A433D1R3_9FUNG|nr:hypothetical protein BC936DRAFT_149026 [Jimgerdemannia flammicorona]